MSTPFDFVAPIQTQGDGLRIYNKDNPLSNAGHLDMLTSNSGTTHIIWGSNGTISGQNGRFEQHAT